MNKVKKELQAICPKEGCTCIAGRAVAYMQQLELGVAGLKTILLKSDQVSLINDKQIERYKSIIRQAAEALEYYAGNFDGREGTRWHKGTFFEEDKFGTTQDASPELARKVRALLLATVFEEEK